MATGTDLDRETAEAEYIRFKTLAASAAIYLKDGPVHFDDAPQALAILIAANVAMRADSKETALEAAGSLHDLMVLEIKQYWRPLREEYLRLQGEATKPAKTPGEEKS